MSDQSELNANFLSWFKQGIEQACDQLPGVPTDKVFEAWALSWIHEIDLTDAYDATDTVEQGDLGIDGFYIDDETAVCYLLQAKYAADPANNSVRPDGVRQLVYACQQLLNKNSSNVIENERLSRIADQLRDAVQGGASVVLQFVAAGTVSEATKKQNMQLAEGISNAQVVLEIWDLPKLEQEYRDRTRPADLDGQWVRFTLASDDRIQSQVSVPGVLDAYQFNFDAASFGTAINPYRDNIVAANVRYHLGKSNAVNKKIRTTLADPDQRGGFWIYNNGLTIVCRELKISKGVVELLNPQIVNGCQTAMALADSTAVLEGSGIPVAARVISVSDDDSGRREQALISERTNSQSAVTAEDLRSNDEVQILIQRAFSELAEPWFYERKRNEWQALPRSERTRFGARRVKKELIGQNWLAYSGQPAASITRKRNLFTEPALYGEVYNPNRDAREMLLPNRLFEYFSTLLRATSKSEREALVPAFTEDKVGMLVKARNQWAAHCVALSREVLTKRYGTVGPEQAWGICELLEKRDSQLNSLASSVLSISQQWLEQLIASSRSDDQGEGVIVVQDVKKALENPDTFNSWRTTYENISAIYGTQPLMELPDFGVS